MQKAIRQLWSHMRVLWPKYTLLPAAPFFLWASFATVGLGEWYRWELYALAFVPMILAYANASTKKLYVGLAPLAFVATFYDLMRYVKNWGLSESRIHLCDLRHLEVLLFGVRWNGSRTTIHDYLQAHSKPFLDFYFSIPYGIFLYACVLFAIYIFFKDYSGLCQFTLSFLVLNIVAFCTYHIYPAPPP